MNHQLKSFNLHLKCAAYQLIIIMEWTQVNTGKTMQNLHNTTDYGYMEDVDNSLSPKLMVQVISAPELLNKLVCNCENYCSDDECIYANQPCTTACVCDHAEDGDGDMLCMNPFTIESLTGNESD